MYWWDYQPMVGITVLFIALLLHLLRSSIGNSNLFELLIVHILLYIYCFEYIQSYDVITCDVRFYWISVNINLNLLDGLQSVFPLSLYPPNDHFHDDWQKLPTTEKLANLPQKVFSCLYMGFNFVKINIGNVK